MTCPKLNKARIPPTNSVEELEYFRGLANKFMNFPGTPYGSVWLSLTDTLEEGVWRDQYTGEEVSQEVLETAVGGLRENTDQNCGLAS